MTKTIHDQELTPVEHGVVGWVFGDHDSIRPVNVSEADRYFCDLISKDPEIEILAHEHFRLTVLAKLADGCIRLLVVPTPKSEEFKLLQNQAPTWFENEGVRVFSVVLRFHRDGVKCSPAEFSPPDSQLRGELPAPLGEVLRPVPLSMSHIEVEKLS